MGIPGAIFDHLYSKINTPKNLYDAFVKGFAGCPSITVMESNVAYKKIWRAGGDRYKKIQTLKVVYKDIVKADVADIEEYMTSRIYTKYGYKLGGKISTLSRKIEKSKSVQP